MVLSRLVHSYVVHGIDDFRLVSLEWTLWLVGWLEERWGKGRKERRRRRKRREREGICLP